MNSPNLLKIKQKSKRKKKNNNLFNKYANKKETPNLLDRHKRIN